MTKAQKKILGTDEAWENGDLGASLEHAKLAGPEIHAAVNEVVAMQMISIRLPKSTIELFKALASLDGIGYQPLMREALCRFAEGEAKRIVMERAREKRAAALVDSREDEQPPPEKRVA